MKTARAVLLLAGVILGLAGTATGLDPTDASWDFQATLDRGWSTTQHVADVDVTGGSWQGTSTDSDPCIIGPELSMAASAAHYLRIRMRCRHTTGDFGRFPYSAGAVYFTTGAHPEFAEDARLDFTAYGNDRWRDYVIHTGGHALWTGTVTRLRIDPCSLRGARVMIDRIDLMRDGTPPESILEHEWNFADGEVIRDTTPTVRLWGIYDNATGATEAEFLYQEVTGGKLGPWIVDGGPDTALEDGLSHTYAGLGEGEYNLSARVRDGAGNEAWLGGDDQVISGLVIDPDAPTRIVVDASARLGPVAREIFGNNYSWHQLAPLVDTETGELPAGLEDEVDAMGLPMLRFPGGCNSDTFYWKQSIGPLESRADQSINGCNTSLTNRGPAKFGLDEFLRYCELHGAVPLFSLRYRCSLDTPQEFKSALQSAADIVEYCRCEVGENPNGGPDWAAERAANGHPDPYGITHFELGNEPWGPDPFGNTVRFIDDPPGGDPASVAERTRNRARLYMMDYFIYQEAMKAVDPEVVLCAAGIMSNQEGMGSGDRDEVAWDAEVYAIGAAYADAVHAHPYYPYSGWQSDATELYWETMATARQIETVLANRRALIRRYDHHRWGDLKLLLSEHNVNYNWWNDPDTGRINRDQSRTLKAALELGDVFGVYLKNADVVHSAEYWHLYGSHVWGCVNKAGEDYWRNGAFFTFRVFNHHFGEVLVDADLLGADTFDYTKPAGSVLPPQYGIPMLSAVGSVSAAGDELYLVVVNRHISQDIESVVALRGFGEGEGDVAAEIWTLNGPSPDSYNTADQTEVTLTESTALYAPSFTYGFPAHSLTSFKFMTP